MSLVIALPAPIQGITHLQVVRLVIDPGFSCIVHLAPGVLDGDGAFQPNMDFQQPTVRRISDDDFAAFLVWCEKERKGVVDQEYGVLFNMMDVMAYLGQQEYAQRGIKV